MNNSDSWRKMTVDNKTGIRVLNFTTLMNGIIIRPEDLGDDDALRELQDN